MKRWFNYEGLDADGQEISGALQAESHLEAGALIQQRGVKPTRTYELDRVRVMADSLACYACGWLSVLPVLGLVAAARAMILFGRVRTQAGREWNPAGRYLVCGFLLAWCGSLISILLSLWLIVQLLTSDGG